MNMKRMLLLTGALLLSAQTAQGWWYGPPGGPGYQRYGGGYTPYARSPSIDVSTQRTGDGYLVSILLNGYQPEDLEVVRWDRWLIVQRAGSDQDSAVSPGAYRYNYSYSTLSRRITLPRDADLSRMEREDREGMIQLTIPSLYR